MKYLLLLPAFLIFGILKPLSAHDLGYTASEVATHNTLYDCYVIFETKVYDITNYLAMHDEKFMPIDEWCGKDMTEDFKSKAGEGRDHTGGYNVLENYEIGVLEETHDDETIAVEEERSILPYFILGGITITSAAIVGYLLVKSKRK